MTPSEKFWLIIILIIMFEWYSSEIEDTIWNRITITLGIHTSTKLLLIRDIVFKLVLIAGFLLSLKFFLKG